jgi:hypothetical protein
VVSERGAERPHAPLWRELLSWSATLPAAGRELGADLLVPEGLPTSARAATAIHPLPLGLAALVGITPGQLASGAARLEGVEGTLRGVEELLERAERGLLARAAPVRRVPEGREGPVAIRAERADDAAVSAAAAALRAICPDLAPPGAALVRAVQTDAGTSLVVLSRSATPVQVAPPGAGWSRAGTTESGVAATVQLAPGEAVVFHRADPVVPATTARGDDAAATERASAPATTSPAPTATAERPARGTPGRQRRARKKT